MVEKGKTSMMSSYGTSATKYNSEDDEELLEGHIVDLYVNFLENFHIQYVDIVMPYVKFKEIILKSCGYITAPTYYLAQQYTSVKQMNKKLKDEWVEKRHRPR